MKTKLSKLLLVLSLSINAVFAGQGAANLGYASDYFFRGALASEESVQSSISYTSSVVGLETSLDAFTNQSVSGDVDTYILGGKISKNLGEFLSVNLGVEHTEFVSGEAILDARLGATLNTVLSPSIAVERNLDESLYTFELEVGHDLDLKVATLNLSALYGNTDQTLTAGKDIDYYALGAGLEKDISESASARFGVDYVDSDVIEQESIFSLALNLKF